MTPTASTATILTATQLETKNMNELFELLDIQTENSRLDERSFIEATVREVFGDDVEIIEFIPYDDEGTTITKRGN